MKIEADDGLNPDRVILAFPQPVREKAFQAEKPYADAILAFVDKGDVPGDREARKEAVLDMLDAMLLEARIEEDELGFREPEEVSVHTIFPSTLSEVDLRKEYKVLQERVKKQTEVDPAYNAAIIELRTPSSAKSGENLLGQLCEITSRNITVTAFDIEGLTRTNLRRYKNELRRQVRMQAAVTGKDLIARCI